MSAMSEKELNGCRKLLKMLSTEDILALKDTVTNRMIAVESVREAIDAIITYSQNAEELLKRKKVHRECIFKYLAAEGIAVSPNSEKQQLIRRTLEFWSGGSVSLFQKPCNVECSENSGLQDLRELGNQFCQWFFLLLNSQNPAAQQQAQDWGPQHFWEDAKMLVLSYTEDQNREEFHGAELVSQRLFALARQERLLFIPNTEGPGLKCLSTPHGLVLVAVAGTIHRDNICLGIFEQVFGLIRAPLDGNRWKIKTLFLKIKGEIGREHLPVVLSYDSNELLQLFTE